LFVYKKKGGIRMVELTGHSLTMEQLKRICVEKEKVTIAEKSMQDVRESRYAVDKIVSDNKTVYGINTGFGKFSDVLIAEDDVEDLQLNLIRSHACGLGTFQGNGVTCNDGTPFECTFERLFRNSSCSCRIAG
jgi:histidine ammonia-lyase